MSLHILNVWLNYNFPENKELEVGYGLHAELDKHVFYFRPYFN